MAAKDQTDGPELLRRLFQAAVAAADPAHCLPPHLPEPPTGRTIVVGAGKAAAAMARAVEDNWQGALSGLVVTRYGHGVDCRRIEVVEAAHPVPDQAGEQAAARVLQAVQGLGEDDLVLCLISGGGSALLSLPAPGLSLPQKQAINRALLKSGAAIDEMNCVRKHLSAVKGGRLAAAAWPARVVTLLISDVPGDDPSVIASGPTVPDPTTRDDALGILKKYAIEVPRAVAAHLGSAESETPNRATRTWPGPKRGWWRPRRRRWKRPPKWRARPACRHSSSAMPSRARRARWRSSMPASPGRWCATGSRRSGRRCCCPVARRR